VQVKTDTKQSHILESYIADLLKDLDAFDARQGSIDTGVVINTNIIKEIQGTPLLKSSLISENWMQQPFQCLVFSVGETVLAAPLIHLGRVQLIKNITPIFTQAKFFCGVIKSFGEQVRVVDTMQLIMPERYDSEVTRNYNHVLVVHPADGEQPWGLAVTAIVDSICVEPTNLRWRNSSGKYPWFMATVLEPMCTLLNIHELDNLLTYNPSNMPTPCLIGIT